MRTKDLMEGNYVCLHNDPNYFYTVESITSKEFLKASFIEENELVLKDARDGSFLEIDIFATDDENENYREQTVFGIPLTKEWLVKFGFVKEVHKNISSSSTWFYLPEFPLRKAGGFADPMYYSLGNYEGVKIYMVHQLQNLYFALTGEELEVKL